MKTGISLPLPFLAETETKEEGTLALREQKHTALSFLETMKKNGADSIELRYWQKDLDLETIADVYRKIIKTDLDITIHGDIEEKQENMDIMESLPWIKTYMDVVFPHNGKTLVVTMHPVKTESRTRKENYDKTVRILGHLCDEIEIKKLPVMIAYENQRERGGPNPAIDYSEMADVVKEIGSSHIGLCWDMGHAYSNFGRSLIAENPTDEFIALTIHTHIHDLFPGTDSTHWPLTCGTVPVGNYVKMLKDSKYKGLYNLELSPEKFKKQDILQAFIKSIKIVKDSYDNNK